jgi:hypothetical protein
LRAPLKVNNVLNDIQNDKTIKATKQNLDQKLLGKLKTTKQTWHTKPGETIFLMDYTYIKYNSRFIAFCWLPL